MCKEAEKCDLKLVEKLVKTDLEMTGSRISRHGLFLSIYRKNFKRILENVNEQRNRKHYENQVLFKRWENKLSESSFLCGFSSS